MNFTDLLVVLIVMALVFLLIKLLQIQAMKEPPKESRVLKQLASLVPDFLIFVGAFFFLRVMFIDCLNNQLIPILNSHCYYQYEKVWPIMIILVGVDIIVRRIIKYRKQSTTLK